MEKYSVFLILFIMSLSGHTAPGQALGYFFQLERAMSWISKTPMGSTIGIETDDDVVVKLSNGEKILEQDKSTTTSFPFIPSRPDLWKTLNIWLEGITSGEIDLNTTSFYLVSNKVSRNSLAQKISDATTPQLAKDCLKEIKTVIAAIEGENKTIAEKLLNYEDKPFLELIQKITFDGGDSVFDRKNIVSDLHIVNCDDDDINSILNELTGWLFNEVVQKWRDKKPAVIERDAFILAKNKLIKLKIENFFNQQVYQLGDLSNETIADHKKNIYIKQLSCIDATDGEKKEAISDYLNSVSKRTQLARKGYVTGKELQLFEEDLEKRWQKIFKTSLIAYKSFTPVEIGTIVCSETLEHNGEIGEVKTRHYFLTRGTYHILAEQLKVGWHPNYKNLLSSTK